MTAIPENDPLDPSSITSPVSGPSNGILTLQRATARYSYAHDGSETTSDSFTYSIQDAAGQTSNTATVSLTVTPVDDVPTATADSATVAEGDTVNVDLASNDLDPEGALDPASITIVTGPPTAAWSSTPMAPSTTPTTAPRPRPTASPTRSRTQPARPPTPPRSP